MAVTGKFFTEGVAALLNGDIDLDTDVIKVALVESTYVPNYTTDQFMSSLTAHELNNAGGNDNGYYAGFANTGRKQLASVGFIESASGVAFDAANLTWLALGAALNPIVYIVIYKHDTSDAASPLIGLLTLTPSMDPNDQDFNVNFSASGVMEILNSGGWNNKGLLACLDGTVDVFSDTIEIALMKTLWTPDPETDQFMEGIKTNELNYGGGNTLGYYAGFGNSGRRALASKAFIKTNLRASIDAADVTYSALDATLDPIRRIVIYHANTSELDSTILGSIQLGADYQPNGSDFVVGWNVNGVLGISV